MPTDMKFTCPKCLHKLAQQNQQLVCSGCGMKWNISEEGIPDFATKDFWWNQIDREDMFKLLGVAVNKGWQTALYNELLPKTGDYTYRYALQESRADWHFLLGLKPEVKVLDVGCGWGAVTTQLARHYAEVHGIDANMLTLKFIHVRAKQEELTNIVLSRTDPLEWHHLPYPDNMFDLVILNGVLEWVGAARFEESPDFYQRKALSEIKRILKPNGLLYVGIENRIAYANFLGGKAHNGVGFADILPRPIANLLSKVLGHSEGFRTYTYSLAGYRKLFSDCGFTIRQILFPHPDYRFPNSLIPLSDRKFMTQWAKSFISGRNSLLLRLALQARVAPLFAYSYGMVIEKE